MIRIFNMFFDTGSFLTEMKQAGGFTCITHCELGRHADKAHEQAGNAVTVNVGHAPELCLKAAHRAAVGPTRARKECT